jgi:hypothetical protein
MGYGITMATGALVRYPEPGVRFLLDDEGPADRYQTCADSGGPVPVAPDSGAFWQEREAARFAKQVPALWLRFQSRASPNPRITGSRDCIALIDSATNVAYGGRGISPWTRVNDSVTNPANLVYSDSNRPVVIPDAQEYHTPLRFLLYLRELIHNSRTAINEPASAFPNPGGMVPSLCIRPNPSSGTLAPTIAYSLPTACCVSLKLYDASGRLVRTLASGYHHAGTSSINLQFSISNPKSEIRNPKSASLPSGVYFIRLEAGGAHATGKLTRQ